MPTQLWHTEKTLSQEIPSWVVWSKDNKLDFLYDFSFANHSTITKHIQQ